MTQYTNQTELKNPMHRDPLLTKQEMVSIPKIKKKIKKF